MNKKTALFAYNKSEEEIKAIDKDITDLQKKHKLYKWEEWLP